MFLGHFAVAFGAKKVSPELSIGTLFLASQFLDLLWPVLLITGIEQVHVEIGNTTVTPLSFDYYPISHSLVMAIVWAISGAILYGLFHYNIKAAATIGVILVSHWVLDFITHRPDLPLFPNDSIKVGLGLWHYQLGTMMVEGLLFMIGIWGYLFTTYPKNRKGTYGLWALVIFLILVYLANVYGPPPPDDSTTIASAGFAMWILVIWGYWVDGHRGVR